MEGALKSNGFNSGEDVQSYAGAHWQPFLSEIRPKFEALLNYTGYYIGNALTNGKLELSERDIGNLNKIDLLSIYFSGGVISSNIPLVREYTGSIAPFGSRSTATNEVLRQEKIKSYFSACLTLTTNMQGATLGNKDGTIGFNATNMPSRNQAVSHVIMKPNSKMLPRPEDKEMILIVDLVDESILPQSIKDRAVFDRANIPNWYPDVYTKMGRHGYSYKLLSTYANQAKVIITSRIHVGLPAAAMGVPVIFVSSVRGRLPGGKESTGRVAGLLDVFHHIRSDTVWPFGDLLGPVPPNPGNHLADRYRASFWNRLKRKHFYKDTAWLFGMVPLQRLGQVNVNQDIQNKFHFLLSKRDLCWQTMRAIEHVFFFHPNSQVYVHSNDITPSELEIFVESGYNLILQEYNLDELKKKAFAAEIAVNLSDEFPTWLILLWDHGGIYLSRNTMILKEIPLTLENGVVMEEDATTPAMAYMKKNSPYADTFLTQKKRRLNEKSLDIPVLSNEETSKCIGDESWMLDRFDMEEALAISLHPLTFAASSSIKFDSLCFKVVEEPCIYCDEVHWEF